jgi:RimJ/RimL family protein N-acetyltransferase
VDSLSTLRLCLRPWAADDLDELHRLWTEPGVRRYLWDDAVISRERAAEALESHFETVASHGIGYWIVELAGDPRVAGFCGFRLFEPGEVELLYGFLPEFWGLGLATEASQVALEYLWAKTALPRVWAKTDPPNRKSVEVMRRLGMREHSSTTASIEYVLERPAYISI